MKSIKPIIFILPALFLFPIPNFAKVLRYSEIDHKLKETWDKAYPVSYTKIISKDTEGKGILHFRNKKKGDRYIYTFIVFLPRYKYEENVLVPEEEGREVFVKLYFDPVEKEEPYSIHLGEFDEKYEKKSKINWIKK